MCVNKCCYVDEAVVINMYENSEAQYTAMWAASLYEFYNHHPWIRYISLLNFLYIVRLEIFVFYNWNVQQSWGLTAQMLLPGYIGKYKIWRSHWSEGVTISISIWAWWLSLQSKQTRNSFWHTINSLQIFDSETYKIVAARSNRHGLGIHLDFYKIVLYVVIPCRSILLSFLIWWHTYIDEQWKFLRWQNIHRSPFIMSSGCLNSSTM